MRMHPSRHLMFICALVGIALLAAPALAQQRAARANTPGGFAEGRLMKKKAKELGLTENTVKKIDALIDAGKEKEAKLVEDNKAAIEALNEVLLQTMPNEKELMAASDKIAEIAAKSRKLKMKSVIEMRSLLAPEELEKFMEIRRKIPARR